MNVRRSPDGAAVARDPATYGALAACITAVVLAACYVPARRAARVDPLVALKHD